MLKFILIIVFGVVILLGNYLYHIDTDATGLMFRDELIPIVKNDEVIEVNSEDYSFNVLKYIDCYSRSKCDLKTKAKIDFDNHDLQVLDIKIDNETMHRDIKVAILVKEKEKEVIEKIVEKETIIYKEIKKEEVKEEIKTNTISGIKDLEIKTNTSFDIFLDTISKDIVCEENVMIDYTNVNLSKAGAYPIYYHLNDQTYMATIYVRD